MASNADLEQRIINAPRWSKNRTALVGQTLRELHDRKAHLDHEGKGDFGRYCSQHFGFSASRAYTLMRAVGLGVDASKDTVIPRTVQTQSEYELLTIPLSKVAFRTLNFTIFKDDASVDLAYFDGTTKVDRHTRLLSSTEWRRTQDALAMILGLGERSGDEDA